MSGTRKIPVAYDAAPGPQPIAVRHSEAMPGLTSTERGLTKQESPPWTIVLAGGEGERLRPLMKRWFGVHRPKQYCTFVGRHSMLRHTMDRAERLAGAGLTLVVITRHHEPHVRDSLDAHPAAAVLAQPRNRDTAPGIFLPLTYIGARDPGGTVVILPSDHFVRPQEVFVAAVRRAMAAARSLPDKLVLLGARPDTAETEYGWIRPGRSVGCIGGQGVREVEGFREKPNAEEAGRLLRSGCLWNTMVMAGRAATLRQLGWRWLPTMMARFEEFAPHIGSADERRALETLYDSLPPLNFSTEILQRALDALVVMELRDVLWSDWGSERRITETLERIGKNPLFATAGAKFPRAKAFGAVDREVPLSSVGDRMPEATAPQTSDH